jgi:hypothetical protein
MRHSGTLCLDEMTAAARAARHEQPSQAIKVHIELESLSYVHNTYSDIPTAPPQHGISGSNLQPGTWDVWAALQAKIKKGTWNV